MSANDPVLNPLTNRYVKVGSRSHMLMKRKLAKKEADEQFEAQAIIRHKKKKALKRAGLLSDSDSEEELIQPKIVKSKSSTANRKPTRDECMRELMKTMEDLNEESDSRELFGSMFDRLLC